MAVPDRHQHLPQYPGKPQGLAALLAWPIGCCESRNAVEPGDRRGVARTVPECLPGRDRDETANPEARYAARETVQLAFVAAIQLLPARQRAVLLLCDVLGWAAAEAATLLESSTASINSALQRARETLAKHDTGSRPQATPLSNPVQQKLLDRYLDAWQRHNVDGFVVLLKEDAMVSMPPWREWFIGRDTIGSFFGEAWKTCNGLRLAPTGANGQPAFAVYELSAGPDPRWAAHSIHVLSIDQETISTITMFVPPTGPDLFTSFGLPLILPDVEDVSTPHRS